MKNSGWKHNPKTKLVVGTERNPTKLEGGQVVINKKATKQNLDRLIEINNDGLDKPIKKEVTTDGTKGGLLKGKPHYDKNGNSLGGIPAVVDGAKNIETEGEEFLLNKEASQKHWKELSKINQSAGNGVPINPSDVGSDEDPQEFRKGGTAKIIFNPNHIPNKWIYSYAKKIKENYPKVWDMGGNIFGNEAFKNLERVVKRGYWTDNEEWMYIKWQSFVARHHKDFRIAGTVAMLKWVDKTDKGWDYMKELIDKEVAKKYAKKGFKRKLLDGGGVGNKFQKNLDELLKEEGWNVSYYDKNINNVPKEKAYQISLSKFDPYYENITIKLPSKLQITIEWIMNKVNKDKVYKSFTENFNKILKSKGLENINAYPTSYGIGVFVFAGYQIPETKKIIENLLNSLGINYNTEYSDANYVFRYKISKSKENIEKIKQLEIKMAEGGGVKIMPQQGTLVTKDKKLKLDYKKNGNNFEFVVYDGKTNPVANYTKTSFKNKQNGIVTMDYNQFINYIYSEGYIDDKNYALGGGVKDITCKSCNWSWNKSDSEKHDEYVCHKCGTDNKMKYGGELAKGIKAEREHIDTAKKLYSQKITPNEAARSIAMEHIKEDPKYYSKMETIDFDKHYDEIKTKYADGGNLEPTYTLNTPSGDKSRLTYLQQVLVRTSTFKNFFGDWETAAKNYLADNRENYKQHFENVSKVMDMSILEPRVVYHGTKTEKEFFMFDVSKEKGQGRPYAYFAHNIEYSKNFTDFSQRGHSNSQALLYECFLNVRNPFRALGDRYETKRKEYDYWLTTIIGTIALDKYDTIEKNTKTKNLESAVNSQIEKYLKDSATNTSVPFWYYMARDTNSEFKYFLLAYGYDGIFYGEEYATDYDVTNPKEYTNAVCIFTANDIKLADGRNLNFDPMNADIRYEKGGVPEQKAPTEHTLNKKEALGNLLFGEKYAKGGATSKSNEDANPMFEKEPDNNRKFVDELIKKMKQ